MKKKIFIGIGAVLGVALLAGAVFIGVLLLNSKAANSGLGGLLAGLGKPVTGETVFMLKLTPAPELPIYHADLIGLVNNIQDNSIFVNSGKTSTSTDGGPSTPSGPLIEVVVSKSTVIYRDTTLDNVPAPQPGSKVNMGVQQVVEQAEISSISQGSTVQVWGQKRGDRLIAETIVVQGGDN